MNGGIRARGRSRRRCGVLALAAALAAYTTPKLTVIRRRGTSRRSSRRASARRRDRTRGDRRPHRHTLTRGQAPGTTVGTVKAQVSALALGGALLPLTGEHHRRARRAPSRPPHRPRASAAATPQRDVAAGAPGRRPDDQPAGVRDPDGGAQTGARRREARLLPGAAGHPGRQGGATFGAKFLSAELTVNGVFSAGHRGRVGRASGRRGGGHRPGQRRPATVASPALIAPGRRHVKAARCRAASAS